MWESQGGRGSGLPEIEEGDVASSGLTSFRDLVPSGGSGSGEGERAPGRSIPRSAPSNIWQPMEVDAMAQWRGVDWLRFLLYRYGACQVLGSTPCNI